MKDFVILDDLLAELEKCHTQKDLDKFIKKHRDVQMIGDLIINAAEDKIKDGEYDTGILYILSAYESKYLNVYDDVTIYLRLAEYYIENGETDKGKDFLKRLCNETVDNYEEALEFRNLKPVWEKYKHLVQGCVNPPVSLDNEAVEEIPTSEKLLEELLEEVCSGGFDAYLSYHSKYFYETLRAAEKCKKVHTVKVLKRVAKKFPNGKVPVNSEITEDIIMDNELDFEKEDDYFYKKVEKELADL